jgi:hypothetical protein
MRRKEADAWAQTLGIPAAIRTALAEPSDLCIVLLGNDYLRACALDEQIQLGGPTLFLCGKHAALRLPRIANLHPVVLSNAEATSFSCGLVGLKGEVAARVLENLANRQELLGGYLRDPQATVANPGFSGVIAEHAALRHRRPNRQAGCKAEFSGTGKPGATGMREVSCTGYQKFARIHIDVHLPAVELEPGRESLSQRGDAGGYVHATKPETLQS